MSKSRFQRYWSRIDNCPGSLERLSPDQASRLKIMVKAAFHSGHSEYRNRIKELVEAIESYTGACPEFKTLEPCFSEECLMFRKALAGMTDKTKPQPSSPDSS
jgi:hypothetical protein